MKLLRQPWTFVILAFLILMIAWGTLIFIATKFRTESVPLDPPVIQP